MKKKVIKFSLDGIQTVSELEGLISNIKEQISKDNIIEKDATISIDRDVLFLYTPYTSNDLDLIEAEKIRRGVEQLTQLSKNYEKTIKEKEAKISRIESKRLNFATVNESLENSINKNKESLLAYQKHLNQLIQFLNAKVFSSTTIIQELERHHSFSPHSVYKEIRYFNESEFLERTTQ